MRTSAAGRAAIVQREGCRLRAYPDTVGVLTIGVGHTGRAAPPAVRAGMTITRARALEILQADLAPMEAGVTALLTRAIPQGCFDAVMSLTFNIGLNRFADSTVLRRINAGQLRAAADAILLWDKPPELKTRRRAERQQFIAGLAATVPATAPKPPPTAPAKSAAPLPRPPVAIPLPPPIATAQPKANPMKVPFFITLLLALFGATAAGAADIDFSPLVNAGITYLLVPVLSALAVWIVGEVGWLAHKVAAKYPAWIDQQTVTAFQGNVSQVLDKAIGFGVQQASSYIGDRNLHANVDGWVASFAAKYANDHAPDLMKQAGDVVQKITARLADHPAVQDLKAKIADPATVAQGAMPVDLHPAAA